jgi:predicted nucleotidyltransferase
MLTELFGSDARVKVLALFMLNAGNEYYLREIAQKTGLAVRSVQRTVADLTKIGLLEREQRGNSVYFHLNRKFSILPELKALFLKTVGLGDLLRDALQKDASIDAAFIYGSVAKHEETASSDIDLVIIGGMSPKDATSILTELEQRLGREINASVFTAEEWHRRRISEEHFVRTLLREPKIFLIGDEEVLEKLAET